MDYNIHNLEYIKNKTIFSSRVLTKTDYKIISIDRLYSDLIHDFLDKRVSAQYEDYDEYFEVNENTIRVKFYHQDYIEKQVTFNLFSVDFHLTSRSELDCNRDFFDEEFFKKFEDSPYKIYIIEISSIKQQLSDSDSEDDEEQEPKPIKFKKSIVQDECVNVTKTNQTYYIQNVAI